MKMHFHVTLSNIFISQSKSPLKKENFLLFMKLIRNNVELQGNWQ